MEKTMKNLSLRNSFIAILSLLMLLSTGCKESDEVDDEGQYIVSEINNLSALTVSEGSLSPAFAINNLAYTVDVDNSVISIQVTATVEDSLASIEINGTATVSGVSSAAINLAVGANSITVLVTAESGDSRTYTITVTKADPPDTTAPVITLNGDNPQTIEVGTAYTELNATATDNTDGDISANIVIDSTAVDTDIVGSYSVTYDVSDAAGNAATTEIRTVEVVDTTAPVITLNGDNPMTVDQGATYTEPGATVTDNVDTGLTVTITGTVDTSTVGDYELNYDVTDTAGNAAVTVIRTVSVTSTTGTQTGHFTDSDVAGLTYTTDTLTGTTDALGTFYYLIGETITFSLGGTIIGDSVAAKATMTPFDLVPGAELYTTATQIKDILYNDLRENERKAFYKFSNILSFLQTLDDDADPDNGININTGMAALFAGVQIDFEQDLFYFDEDKKLRIITHQAAAQGLLNRASIKKEGFALDHFYSEQNISHNITVESTSGYDSDGDGSPNSVRTFTYDAIGNQLSESNDTDGDGNPNRVYTVTYDSYGNRLSYSSDSDGDGNLNSYATYTYDSNGNQLTLSNDSDYDGNPNRISSYVYDANGNNITYSSDTDADGSPNRVRTYTYDANGNILTHSYDSDNDGFPNSIDTYTYDANDNLLTESDDSDGDGNPDEIYTYTYDANANKLTESYDSDGDSNPNDHYTYTYDANNNRLTESYDTDNDGTPERIDTFTYDANNNLLTVSADYDVDGTPDRIETYTYDANNNRLTYIDDTNGNGTQNRTNTYTYDVNGNLLVETYDSGSQPVRTSTYTYDVNNNRLTYSYDTDDDGNPNSINTYTYDANDNRLTDSDDSDADGNPNTIRTYTFVNSTWVAILYFLD